MSSESSIPNDQIIDNSVMLLQRCTKLLKRLLAYLEDPLNANTVEEFLIAVELIFQADTLANKLMRLVKNKGNECERG
jgi:hypothetical protein